MLIGNWVVHVCIKSYSELHLYVSHFSFLSYTNLGEIFDSFSSAVPARLPTTGNTWAWSRSPILNPKHVFYDQGCGMDLSCKEESDTVLYAKKYIYLSFWEGHVPAPRGYKKKAWSFFVFVERWFFLSTWLNHVTFFLQSALLVWK